MTVILAIDAAWTDKQPSGVAVVQKIRNHYVCKGLAASYDSFHQLALGTPVDWLSKPKGSKPRINQLLADASTLAGGKNIDLVTIDMPVATIPFDTRRGGDNLLSKDWGAQKCAVHSPTKERPGKLGRKLSTDFEKAGYPVATASTKPGTKKHLVEVYPHPPVVQLMNEEERVPYKTRNSNNYWPGYSVDQRKKFLRDLHFYLLNILKTKIDGVEFEIPPLDEIPGIGMMKMYEDSIDALVCAWVGMMYIDKKIVAYGDNTSAIWIPEL
jgi:predicted RNase H-like nuclease